MIGDLHLRFETREQAAGVSLHRTADRLGQGAQ